MILPFQLDLPEDTLPSYDQVVKKGMSLEFDQIYAQRDEILKRFGQNRTLDNSASRGLSYNPSHTTRKEIFRSQNLTPSYADIQDRSFIKDQSAISWDNQQEKNVVSAMIQKKKKDKKD